MKTKTWWRRTERLDTNSFFGLNNIRICNIEECKVEWRNHLNDRIFDEKEKQEVRIRGYFTCFYWCHSFTNRFDDARRFVTLLKKNIDSKSKSQVQRTRMTGKTPSGSRPSSVYASVWQRAAKRFWKRRRRKVENGQEKIFSMIDDELWLELRLCPVVKLRLLRMTTVLWLSKQRLLCIWLLAEKEKNHRNRFEFFEFTPSVDVVELIFRFESKKTKRNERTGENGLGRTTVKDVDRQSSSSIDVGRTRKFDEIWENFSSNFDFFRIFDEKNLFVIDFDWTVKWVIIEKSSAMSFRSSVCL